MLRCGLPFLPPCCRPRLGRAPVGFGSVRPAATGALRLPQSCTNHVPRKSLAPPPCGFGASFVGYRPHPPRCAANHSLRGNKATEHRSWATAHTRQSAQQVTRSVATWPRSIVRGRLPTPAKVRGKSLAPWQQGHGASFVGDCPHPPKCAESHSRLRLAASALRSWATAHTRQSARQITRSVTLRVAGRAMALRRVP